MDPITSALFVGAGLATSLYSNRSQARIEAANIKLQTEQAKLQASEMAYERTKSYRQNASTALALSGMGFGSTTALGVLGAQSYGNYVADINAINRKSSFAQAAGEANKALSKSKGFGNDVVAIDSAVSLASKLGLFSLPNKRKK